MAENSEHVYATLLMTDNYLPGAMVLGHSLKDGGTSKQLIALITPETISYATIDELRKVYDQVIPIPQVRNTSPGNLYLMGREDLASTFSKIALWGLIQFTRVVYIDADVVALRAPDELFHLKSSFAAVPDVGWPDIFNSGVMSLTPNLQDYYALQSLATDGVSFDGADQGLLNMHFSNNLWERLSFTYNCTPSGNYQYTPAYRYFGSQISLIHFIGRQKPWQMSRHAAGFGGVYKELTARWWAVYDKYYGRPAYSAPSNQPPLHQQSSYQTQSHQAHSHQVHSHQVQSQQVQSQQAYSHQGSSYQAPPSPSPVIHEPVKESIVHMHVHSEPDYHTPHFSPLSNTESQQHQPFEPEHRVEPPIPELIVQPPPEDAPRSPEPERKFSAPHVQWDPARAPPPAQSEPEAANFPDTIYEMSRDTELYKPPPVFSAPPSNMYYEVPKEKPKVNERPKAIFPWEVNQPRATRVFPDEPPPPPVPDPDHMPEPLPLLDTSGTEIPQDGIGTSDAQQISVASSSAAKFGISSLDFTSYSRVNAWDLVPGISSYAEAWKSHRRGKSGTTGSPSIVTKRREDTVRRPSLILTDFPTEVERPSLPVTPAPIRAGDNFWGREQSTEGLPHAQGVPSPETWDPSARLDELQRRQSEVLSKAFLAMAPTSKVLPSREQIKSAITSIDENSAGQPISQEQIASVVTVLEGNSENPQTDVEVLNRPEEALLEEPPMEETSLQETPAEETPSTNPIANEEDSDGQPTNSKLSTSLEETSMDSKAHISAEGNPDLDPATVVNTNGLQAESNTLTLPVKNSTDTSTTLGQGPRGRETSSEALSLSEKTLNTLPAKTEKSLNGQQDGPGKPEALPLLEKSLDTVSTEIDKHPNGHEAGSELLPLQEEKSEIGQVMTARDIVIEQPSPKTLTAVLQSPTANDANSRVPSRDITEPISSLESASVS